MSVANRVGGNYRKTDETLKIEKQICQYLSQVKNKLPLDKAIGEKLFNVLLKEMPKNSGVDYRKHGISFLYNDIYYNLFPKLSNNDRSH